MLSYIPQPLIIFNFESGSSRATQLPGLGLNLSAFCGSASSLGITGVRQGVVVTWKQVGLRRCDSCPPASSPRRYPLSPWSCGKILEAGWAGQTWVLRGTCSLSYPRALGQSLLVGIRDLFPEINSQLPPVPTDSRLTNSAELLQEVLGVPDRKWGCPKFQRGVGS